MSSDEPVVEDPDVEPEPDPGKPQSSFRDQLAGDLINVFLDLDYFGELHRIGGQMIRCVIDEDVYRQAQGARDYGVTRTGFVLYCRESDLDRQTEGTQLEIDGRLYTIEDWRVDEGMHRVTLTGVMSY